MGVVSQIFNVQGDRSGGIARKVSRSRRPNDCMQAWDSLWIVRFQGNLKIGFCVIARHKILGIKGIFLIIHL